MAYKKNRTRLPLRDVCYGANEISFAAGRWLDCSNFHADDGTLENGRIRKKRRSLGRNQVASNFRFSLAKSTANLTISFI